MASIDIHMKKCTATRPSTYQRDIFTQNPSSAVKMSTSTIDAYSDPNQFVRSEDGAIVWAQPEDTEQDRLLRQHREESMNAGVSWLMSERDLLRQKELYDNNARVRIAADISRQITRHPRSQLHTATSRCRQHSSPSQSEYTAVNRRRVDEDTLLALAMAVSESMTPPLSPLPLPVPLTRAHPATRSTNNGIQRQLPNQVTNYSDDSDDDLILAQIIFSMNTDDNAPSGGRGAQPVPVVAVEPPQQPPRQSHSLPPSYTFQSDPSETATRDIVQSSASSRQTEDISAAAGSSNARATFRPDDMSYDNLLLLDEFNRRRSGAGLSTRQLHGLESLLVCLALPTAPHSSGGVDESAVSGGGPSCSICMEEFKQGDRAVRLKNCGHVFHGQCAGPWFANHTCCPNCRGEVAPAAACCRRGGRG
jgi:hypothetical protein